MTNPNTMRPSTAKIRLKNFIQSPKNTAREIHPARHFFVHLLLNFYSFFLNKPTSHEINLKGSITIHTMSFRR